MTVTPPCRYKAYEQIIKLSLCAAGGSCPKRAAVARANQAGLKYGGVVNRAIVENRRPERRRSTSFCRDGNGGLLAIAGSWQTRFLTLPGENKALVIFKAIRRTKSCRSRSPP